MGTSSMRTLRKIGILGGTFDPPHVAHLIVGESALDVAGLDAVFFVPAFQSPSKTGLPGASARQRVTMTRLAVKGNPGFKCLDIEAKRKGRSYTVETLEELTAEAPGTEFVLILGADSFLDFSAWKSPERIVQLASLLVYPRNGFSLSPDLPFFRHARMMEGPSVEVSSSMIRRRVAMGKSIRYLVPDAVDRYIRLHRLYRRD
ncbi:MAG: putative nicotinate-nucleotide adenylyltransferase [Bacteroidia bacterium]|nr:MAG: putative nicotinate-nucleotide adenylyltransferase [Bacteroidia bacterium]